MRRIRCAIYTRKSTEDGLEQDFNSLDAKREACEAYIASQKHEGWELLPDHYDDGGISGWHLDRPALKQLMQAVDEKRVDQIVVYKIDRLTRSLTDFARLVDRLDAVQASFVSVTQAFNTATSMGRLTLNMLLSFAQFEREVTAERIRDEIQHRLADGAAKARGSKGKGISSPLAGKLFDETGDRLTPSHSRKNGKRLRYYISRRLVIDRRHTHPGAWRLPADQLERLLTKAVEQHLARPEAATALTLDLGAPQVATIAAKLAKPQKARRYLALIQRAELRPCKITILLDKGDLSALLGCAPGQINPVELTLEAPFQMRRRGAELKLHLGDVPSEIDQTLVNNIVKARCWLGMITAGRTTADIAQMEGLSNRRIQDLLPLAFLSPDLLEAIAAGEQPVGLTTDYLIKTGFPTAWSEQRTQFAAL